MSTRNPPKHFAAGIGVYSPWRGQDNRVKAALTRQAPTRAYEWKIGYWKDGRFVEAEPKLADNARVRVRHKYGWSRRPHKKSELRFDSEKGWQRKAV